MTVDEMGNKHSTYEQLLKAEASLWCLVRNNTVFTYLEFVDITVSPYNNRLEGGVNAQLRAMLRNHRGLSLSVPELLRCMPTDKTHCQHLQAIK